MKGERDSLPVSTNIPWTTPLLALLYSLPGNYCCPAVPAVSGIQLRSQPLFKGHRLVLFHWLKERGCPVPTHSTSGSSGSVRHNTTPTSWWELDPSLAADPKASSQSHRCTQELCTVGFPAFHLLGHFSSVTWNFSKCSTGGPSAEGQVGGGLLLTPNTLASTGHSIYIRFLVLKQQEKVHFYIPLGPCQIILAQNELFLY